MAKITVILKEKNKDGSHITQTWPDGCMFATDKLMGNGNLERTGELWIRKETGNGQSKTVDILAVYPPGEWIACQVDQEKPNAKR